MKLHVTFQLGPDLVIQARRKEIRERIKAYAAIAEDRLGRQAILVEFEGDAWEIAEAYRTLHRNLLSIPLSVTVDPPNPEMLPEEMTRGAARDAAVLVDALIDGGLLEDQGIDLKDLLRRLVALAGEVEASA